MSEYLEDLINRRFDEVTDLIEDRYESLSARLNRRFRELRGIMSDVRSDFEEANVQLATAITELADRLVLPDLKDITQDDIDRVNGQAQLIRSLAVESPSVPVEEPPVEGEETPVEEIPDTPTEEGNGL